MPDIHIDVGEPTEEQIAAMEPRMLAFMVPNIPITDDEKTAFDLAVEYQIAHEQTIISKLSDAADLPNGTKSFSIGDFSMTFEDGTFTGEITRRTICPTAYGILLTAGLLYRGVERRCYCGAD